MKPILQIPAGSASHMIGIGVQVGSVQIVPVSVTNHIVAIKAVNKENSSIVAGGIAVNQETMDELALAWIKHRALEGQVFNNMTNS